MIEQHAGQTSNISVPWKSCRVCKKNENTVTFKSPRDFASHLKMVHCRKEGGSYICTYGPNLLCRNLPLEGVSGKDYDIHVSRFHVAPCVEQQHKLLGEAREEDNDCNNGQAQGDIANLGDPYVHNSIDNTASETTRPAHHRQSAGNII